MQARVPQSLRNDTGSGDYMSVCAYPTLRQVADVTSKGGVQGVETFDSELVVSVREYYAVSHAALRIDDELAERGVEDGDGTFVGCTNH